jgi:hypothetical protein
LVEDIANGCQILYPMLYITVEEQLTVDITVDNAVVCIDGSSVISSAVTNGSGVYNYQWQSSPDGSGSWTNITLNGTLSTYAAPTSAVGTIFYRVMVTDLANGCNDPISNVVSVTVEDQPTVSIAVDNPVVCIGGSALITSSITNGSAFILTSGNPAPMDLQVDQYHDQRYIR